MEYPSVKIKELIINIILLLELELSKNDYWLRYFKYILEQFDKESDKKEFIRSLSQIFQGGMRSFSDFVLHKNGIPMIEENNQLETLKDQLFDACKEALSN